MSKGFAGDAGRPSDEPFAVIPGGDGTPIPKPPPHLKNNAQWNRLWNVGRSWLSNDAHFDLMVLICDAQVALDHLRAALAEMPLSELAMQSNSMRQDMLRLAKETRDQEKHLASLLTLAKFAPDPKRQPVAPRQRSKLEALQAKRS